MKKRISTMIDLLVIFIVSGLGITFSLRLLPWIERLPDFSRIFLMSACQFSIAGLGVVVVMLFRKEKFGDFGLNKENIGKSLAFGAVFIIVYLCMIFILKGELTWMPFKQVNVTSLSISLRFPLNVIGMALIVCSWGFFEGFTLIYISKKVNSLFPMMNPILKVGPIIVVGGNILVHMAVGQNFLESASGIIETLAVLLIPELTGNAFGGILIFMLSWNAI